MASYVVMQPPGEGAEDAVFVRDGFHVLAFLLPLFWLLFHRLWIEAGLFLVAALMLGVAGTYPHLGVAVTVLSLMLALLVGLEGARLRLDALRRRGWRDVGVVDAVDRGEAELRFYAGVLPLKAPREPAAPLPAAPYRPAASSGPALGLFDYPGRR